MHMFMCLTVAEALPLLDLPSSFKANNSAAVSARSSSNLDSPRGPARLDIYGFGGLYPL